MSKRAAVRRERELEPASEEQMVKRRQVIEMLRDQMAVPPTKKDLELWEELKASIERAR